MNKLQQEVASFTRNQADRRQFKTFYQLVKMHSLLNNLFLSYSINQEVYSAEVRETLKRINILKQQLSKHDLRRFCELWGIETEYNNLDNINSEPVKQRVGLAVVHIGSIFPRLCEDTQIASSFRDIHQTLSKFVTTLRRMREEEKEMSSNLIRIIGDFESLESSFNEKYKKISDSFEESSRSDLKDQLERFRVEFEKAYHF